MKFRTQIAPNSNNDFGSSNSSFRVKKPESDENKSYSWKQVMVKKARIMFWPSKILWPQANLKITTFLTLYDSMFTYPLW